MNSENNNNIYFLKKSEIILFIMDFLRSEKLFRSLITLEQETNLSLFSYNQEILFFRKLILEGNFQEAEQLLQPLQKNINFNYKAALYEIKKEKFLEAVETVPDPNNNNSEVENLVKELKEIHKLCDKNEFQKLLKCLSNTPSITDQEEYKNWNPISGRLNCFERVRKFLEVIYPKKQNENFYTNDLMLNVFRSVFFLTTVGNSNNFNNIKFIQILNNFVNEVEKDIKENNIKMKVCVDDDLKKFNNKLNNNNNNNLENNLLLKSNRNELILSKSINDEMLINNKINHNNNNNQNFNSNNTNNNVDVTTKEFDKSVLSNETINITNINNNKNDNNNNNNNNNLNNNNLNNNNNNNNYEMLSLNSNMENENKNILNNLYTEEYSNIGNGYLKYNNYDICSFTLSKKFEDTHPIRTSCFSPKGDYFAIGTNSKSLKIYSLKNVINNFENRIPIVQENIDSSIFSPLVFEQKKHHAGSLYCLDWSASGRLLASGSNDKIIKLLVVPKLAENLSINKEDKKEESNIEEDDDSTILYLPIAGHNGTVRSVVFDPTSDLVLFSGGTLDKDIKIWNTETGDLNGILSGHSGDIHTLKWSNDGNFFCSGGTDKNIKFWDLRNLKCINNINLNKYDVINDIALYKKNSNFYIAVGHYDGKITLWNYEGGLIKEIKKSNNEIRNVNFSPDGRYLLSAGFDGTIKLFDVNDEFKFCGKLEHDDKVVSAKWHPDLPFILSTSADKTAKLWEPKNY